MVAYGPLSNRDKSIIFISLNGNKINISISFLFNISQYRYETLHEIQHVFENLSKKNMDKVMGGSYACKIANNYGIDSLFLYSENSLCEAINTAVNFCMIYRNEMEQSALFKTVASINNSGIVSIDENNNITSINKEGEAILGLSKEKLLGQNIASWIDEYQLTNNGTGQQPIIFSFNNEKTAANLSPVYIGNEKVGAILVINDVKEIQQKELHIRSRINKKTMTAQYHFSDIIGSSDMIKDVKKTANKFSRATAPILIQGESGTGKELFAQSIHHASDRKEASFVAVNCAAIPENLLDSELFGYEDAAFTGAKKGGKKGLFELAHQVTIFFDEIDALPLHLQPKLLRVLQEREIMKIGGDKVIPVNIRIITATNNNLMESIRNKSFREDLFYRINVLQLFIPPLRDRKEDIKEIVKEHFSFWKESKSLMTPDILRLLKQHSFPGNIRELINILERFKVYCAEESLNKNIIQYYMSQAIFPNISASIGSNNSIQEEELDLKEHEKTLIKAALQKHKGKKDMAARELGISRATLWRKLNN
jgi:transcriptional regulator with PAS, ATPase and Fis domain